MGAILLFVFNIFKILVNFMTFLRSFILFFFNTPILEMLKSGGKIGCRILKEFLNIDKFVSLH